MGYDVHITRATDLTKSDSVPITMDEWIRYVSTDGEMRLDGFAEVKSPDGKTIRYDNPGLTIWTAYSKQGSSGPAYFDFRNAAIVVKDPDAEILEKMKQIAVQLNANVIGDESELYCGPKQPEQSHVKTDAPKLQKLDWLAIAIPTTWATGFTLSGVLIAAKGFSYAMKGLANDKVIAFGSILSVTFLSLGYMGIRNVIAITRRQPEAKSQVILFVALTLVLGYLMLWRR